MGEGLPKTADQVVYTEKKGCRVCGSLHLESVLDLGLQYLPRFVERPDGNLPQAPLHLVRCDRCHLLQLLHTTNPDLLFKEFWYRSGVNASMRGALRELADYSNLARKGSTMYRGGHRGTWLDIGANDGYLLSVVPDEYRKVACEPALNFASELEELADTVIADYFTRKACNGEIYDVITSAAMFYDLDDPGTFLDDIRKSLNAGGIWVNQLNDAPSMLKQNAFDAVCLPPDGLVLTERGAVPIADIREGERVLTHKGRYMPVVETMSRHHDGQVVRLRAYGFGYDTVVTENHPILVNRGGMAGWVPAGEVVVGDRVARPVVSERHDVATVSMKCGRGRAGYRYKSVEANEDLFRVAGYYLAEGFVSPASTSVSVTFTFGLSAEEIALAEDCATRLEAIGFTARRAKAHTSNTVVAYGGIARWLKETFGTGSSVKRIPSWVMMLPREKLAALYAGYMAGDGYEYRGSCMRASTVSDELALGISLIANRLGYVASACKQQRAALCVIGGRSVSQRPLWDVLVRQETKRDLKSRLDAEYQWGTVRLVTREPYSGVVHNISVLDDSSYVTPGMTVHNCHEHLTYYDVHTLETLYRAHGLGITNVTFNDVNGSSMRVTAMLSQDADQMLQFTLKDIPKATRKDVERFAARVKRWRTVFREALYRWGPGLWCYGASTKGGTLMQYLDCFELFEAVADANPRKHGLRMVGGWTPIKSEEDFRLAKPKYALVLPWAFRNEFVEREAETRANGTALLFPLPNPEIVL